MKKSTYIIWRIIRVILLTLFFPIWFPIACAILALTYVIFIPLSDWFSEVSNDWENDQRAKKAEK